MISETQLDKIMTVDANEYKGGSKIYNMIDAFIKKYQKLALTVNVNKPAGVKTVKKVPNQNILIFEGNGEDVVVDGEYTKTPFTIIADKVNLVISGDLTTNAMFLVNNGNIKFDNGNLCNKKNQEVQGIFVVRNGKFMNSPSSLANNSNARPRCNYGGLYVKGVLIGDGIDTLVKARRSQLNSWFYLVGDNANSHIAQRRNKIFNGAAVLIEYSPSLRSALPPRANEFTKALEVYKK